MLAPVAALCLRVTSLALLYYATLNAPYNTIKSIGVVYAIAKINQGDGYTFDGTIHNWGCQAKAKKF
jgi:hypothetical protein